MKERKKQANKQTNKQKKERKKERKRKLIKQRFFHAHVLCGIMLYRYRDNNCEALSVFLCSLLGNWVIPVLYFY